MPVVSAKNLPLTSTSADLGFGGAELERQLADETAEQKRRRLLGLGQTSTANPILSPASLSLFQSMGLSRGIR
jgi:hypothetical protein